MLNHHLGVLLIDNLPQRRTLLERELNRLGHPVVDQLEDTSALQPPVEAHQPDLLLIATDTPSQQLLNALTDLSNATPTPIILFAEQQKAARRADRAIEAGVSSFIAGDLPLPRLQPIIEAALAHFRCYQQLRNELEVTRDQLSSRKITEKAKGLLIKHHNCSEDQAFNTLRKLAMDRGQKMTEVASEVIRMFEH